MINATSTPGKHAAETEAFETDVLAWRRGEGRMIKTGEGSEATVVVVVVVVAVVVIIPPLLACCQEVMALIVGKC